MTETPDTPPETAAKEPPQRIFAGGRVWTREDDAVMCPIGFELALLHGSSARFSGISSDRDGMGEPAKEEE